MRLRVGINTGDEEVTDEDIDRAMGQMDGDGSGEVDFDECVYPAVAATTGFACTLRCNVQPWLATEATHRMCTVS